MNANEPCPCGATLTYDECCGRYHRGEPAPTAEALMRSRYCAYQQRNEQYLLDTWHSSTRPPQLDLSHGPEQWLSLTIKASSAGQADDREGMVHFLARYRANHQEGALEERSRFLQEDGRWYYVDGAMNDRTAKVGRNDPCPCGSGKKFKKCCM